MRDVEGQGEMWFLLSDVAVCTEQCSLLTEPVAEDGGVGPLREGVRAAHARDVHSRGDQGLHHVQTRLGRSRAQVFPLVSWVRFPAFACSG